MTDVALMAGASPKPKLDHPVAPTTAILFVSILIAGIVYAGLNIYLEVRDAGVITESWLPFILLRIALLIALGFEFVNGFHDTANAVATVIYAHSLAPNVAVLWSRHAYKGELGDATKYIPLWVKVSLAIALGLGTMISWKRIVVTVGEKIGKSHLTYAQGASAELVAMGTIAGADMFGLAVSTTQVLSSGVAGTMAANGSGLQMATVRNLLMAWVLTLPMAVLLSGSLYWLLSHI
jgi:phosphate/sulfate permease